MKRGRCFVFGWTHNPRFCHGFDGAVTPAPVDGVTGALGLRLYTEEMITSLKLGALSGFWQVGSQACDGYLEKGELTESDNDNQG